MKIGIKTQMVVLLLIFGIVPALLIGYISYTSTKLLETNTRLALQDVAVNIADKIDRNLFERYGDVQAFSINQAIQQKDSWYKPKETENPVIQIMNQYIQKYGIYYLTILVDLDGKVIAVNTKDAKGQAINTDFLFQKNFKDAVWFQNCIKGNFTAKTPFTAPGNDRMTGTYIEDIHVDADVKQAYPSDISLTVGFSAPVYIDGKVVAVWSNRACFSLVEDIIADAYTTLKSRIPSTEITLLDSQGNIIVDYDPTLQNGDTSIKHDMEKVIFKFNLVSNNVSSAKKAVAGETGSEYSFHARKKILQAASYTHLKGALGYPGMNWSVLVRVANTEINKDAFAIRRKIEITVFLSLVLLIAAGWITGNRSVKPILSLMQGVARIADGDLTVRTRIESKNELATLSQTINRMAEKLSELIQGIQSTADQVSSSSSELSSASQNLASASSEQAASLVETSAAIEELVSSIETNAKNALKTNEISLQVSKDAETGREAVQESVSAMKQIAEKITIIDDIADQTNLLALNAAIEAARAGDMGKGFAVVAVEVRKLAERSQLAAQEIIALSRESVTKAENAGNLINEVIPVIQQSSQRMHDIAKICKEQSTSAEQVRTAVTQIEKATQQNSATSEQTAASSEELSAQAQYLQEMISRFTVDT